MVGMFIFIWCMIAFGLILLVESQKPADVGKWEARGVYLLVLLFWPALLAWMLTPGDE